MEKILYITDYCLTPFQHIPDSGILCEGSKITAVGGQSAFKNEKDLRIVDLSGFYAVPGFIDTHIHGAGGFDSTSAYENPDKIIDMCRTLAPHGVTSFVPTIVSAPIDNMLRAITTMTTLFEKNFDGAEPVGLHLEGPFINRGKHGSQRMEDIIDIDLGIARELIAAGKGRIMTFTFAPELEHATELVELLRENNISPSMGHSVANEADVLRAIDAGATRCTHLYNGMPSLHQRNVGLTAVALTDDRVSIEMILDGAHLHPRMVDLACRAKAKDKLIGVSDSIEGAGLSDGSYHIGGAEVQVRNGFVTTEEGVLAGTTMTLEVGWHHLVTYTHMKQTDAAACFTSNPARSVGLGDRGEISPGKRADISFFCTRSNNARMTIRAGEIIYDSDNIGDNDSDDDEL